MSEPRVWGAFTQADLDAAYNNMAAFPDSTRRLADWTARSDVLRAEQPGELDLPYGPGPRNRFDVFRCGAADAPLVVFIHGGWWQRNSKEVFSCLARGPLAHGRDVALLGYTLAPQATLAQIVAEIHAGLDALARHQDQLGRSAGCILCGWSAGGHLTAMVLGHPSVRAGLPISGVFDLEPIRLSYINVKLRLAADEVAKFSPLYLPLPPKPFTLVYGGAELPELQRQSTAFAAARQTGLLALPGHDHFSILEEMAAPDGAITAALCAA